MNVSFGFNIARANINWSNLSVHDLRRDKKFKHSKNSNINWKLTKYNQSGKLEDYDKLMTNHCQSYVKKYNQRQKMQGHKKRCISVKNYYKKHGKNASRNVIFSIANHNQRNRLEQLVLKHERPLFKKYGYDKKLALKFLRTKIEPNALVTEMKGFNKRHSHLKICEYVIHCDEGIIHCHAHLVALPSPTNTKYKRPSFSFSKAVREEGNSKDGRKALAYIQRQEAPKAVKDLSDAMVYPLKYVRTGNATKLSGNQYKNYAKASDKAKNERATASSATSVARSASSAKSTAVKDYKSYMTSFFTSGYYDGSKAGSKVNSKSADSRTIDAKSSASTSASNAANLAYSSISTSWASRSHDLDIKEHHINTTAKATNNLKNNLINSFRDEENQKKLNNMNYHKVFKILIFWSKDMQKLAKKVKRAKEKARRIIAYAKVKAKDFLMPNKYGEKIIQNFLWQHQDCYPNIYNKNPSQLHGQKLMYQFNSTAHNYYEFDSPKAKREDQQIKARANDHGPTWTPN